MGYELSRGQARDWRTDGRTHRQTQATTIPEGQNWPRVKTFFCKWQGLNVKNEHNSNKSFYHCLTPTILFFSRNYPMLYKTSCIMIFLSHWGLVMPYGIMDCGQHWGNGLLPDDSHCLNQCWQLSTWKHTAVKFDSINFSKCCLKNVCHFAGSLSLLIIIYYDCSSDDLSREVVHHLKMVSHHVLVSKDRHVWYATFLHNRTWI